MIKAIIFDFDGVILESAEIKTDAFRELFSEHASKIEEIVGYHLLNGGISRYVKFRYIYERILGIGLSKQKERELGERFSQIALQKILDAPFVAGAKEFLDEKRGKYQFFIASGTPDAELLDIIRIRQLGGYFQEAHGSPMKKIDIINAIIKNYRFAKEEVVYVGDAQSDLIAAEEAKIVYIERRSDFRAKPGDHSLIVRDLSGLEEVLGKIVNSNYAEGK